MGVSRASLLLCVFGVVLVGGLAVDASGDGLRVIGDLKHDTDPLAADTDGDGLSDHAEIHEHDTDPLDTDSDGDRLTDYEEVHEYGTTPSFRDTDRDRLSDFDEVRKYGTDPTREDTTGDGLPDYDEIEEYGTDPTTRDTTGDGLLDSEQLDTYGTDPTINDTDDDGVSDYDEIHRYGMDPLEEDSRGTGLSDARALQLFGDPSQDPFLNETTALEPVVERHEHLHVDRPLGSVNVSIDGEDSSGDGFSDAYSEREGNLTADEMDIFVQVTYDENHTIPISSLLLVQEAFANAPVTNAEGDEVGINLHFYIDTESEPRSLPSTMTASTYEYEYSFDRTFTAKGYGFHHLLFADTVVNPDRPSQDIAGLALSDLDAVLVEPHTTSPRQAATIMHELGHRFGLSPSTFDGIDSRSYSYDEYPSLMNYHSDDQLEYSNGTGFDDWGYIEENYRHHFPLRWYLP